LFKKTGCSSDFGEVLWIAQVAAEKPARTTCKMSFCDGIILDVRRGSNRWMEKIA
jgi:hypothetical protein